MTLVTMSLFHQIYDYNEEGPTIIDERFEDRLDWNGSKKSTDIQDASIYLFNVTFNDSGTYRCFINRILTYPAYEYQTQITKIIHLTVVAKGVVTLVTSSLLPGVRFTGAKYVARGPGSSAG